MSFLTKKSFLSIDDILAKSQSKASHENARSVEEINPLACRVENHAPSNSLSLLSVPQACATTNIKSLMEAVSAVGMCRTSAVSATQLDGEPNPMVFWSTAKGGIDCQQEHSGHPSFLMNLQRKSKREINSRRQRTSFTAEQTIKLELEFQMNEYITRSRRFELADLLGLSENQIKIWYQNRRAKDKRIEKAHLESNIRRQLNHLAFGSNPFSFLSNKTAVAGLDEIQSVERLATNDLLSPDRLMFSSLQFPKNSNLELTHKAALENALSFLT